MTRVQVYLDPKHIDILDLIAIQNGTTRSQALRETIETAQFKIVSKTKTQKISSKYDPLIKMAGFAKNAPLGISENVDDIYQHD